MATMRFGPWAERISAWAKQGLDVYCYFDNDENGYAPAMPFASRSCLPRSASSSVPGINL
jgi:uncharacterized protein YecE (DUF72 family)